MVPEVNQLVPNPPFLYPQVKHQVTLTVFGCFQGVEKECIGNKWVNVIVKFPSIWIILLER